MVADASLHRREFGPLRLVGRIKWLIDPEFRGVGLGMTLVNLLMDAAYLAGGGCESRRVWIPKNSHSDRVSPFNRLVHLDDAGSRRVHG